MKCIKCDHILPDDSLFCQYCGSEQVVHTEDIKEPSNVTLIPDTGASSIASQDSFNTDRILASEDPLKALMEAQAKETIRVMEVNRIAQSNNEDDPEFGLVPEKPIYTLANDIVEGQRAYLSKLRTSNGEKITWKRLGSTSAAGIHGMIDIYETFLPSGQPYKTLYINMYGAKKSISTPNGFTAVGVSANSATAPKDVISTAQSQKSIKKTRHVFCKKCGSLINSKTKKCTGCGKQYFKLKFSGILCMLLVLLLSLSGFLGYCYFSFLEALNEQKFIQAQQYYELIPFSADILSNENEYLDAGILWERGQYIAAYRKLVNIKDYPVPAAFLERAKEKLYALGQSEFRDEDYTNAEKYFAQLENYKRSKDYLLLIDCRAWYVDSSEYNQLMKLLNSNFENTAEIILMNEFVFEEYLLSRWEDSSGNKYFEIYDDGDGQRARYNLPDKGTYGYYYLSNGMYKIGDDESSAVKSFRFTIIDEDTITVYCYRDGSTYRLYRQ